MPKKRGISQMNSNSTKKKKAEPESYDVEKIITHISVKDFKVKSKAGKLRHKCPTRLNSKCKTLYLVKWVGWPDSDNTWEPEENFNDAEMIREYKAKISEREKQQENASESLLPHEKKEYLDYYAFGEKLGGETNQGDVFEVKHKLTGESYAVKIIPHENNFTDVIKRIRLQKKAEHENVVNIVDYYYFPDFSFVTFELCDQALLDQIESDGPLPKDNLVKLAKDILMGLNHIHKFGIHRDIKPDNILKKGDTYKIGDFGIFSEQKLHTSFCGTQGYIAPEVDGKEQYSSLIDLYSFGVVLAEAASGTFLSDEITLESIIHKLDPFVKSLVSGLMLENSTYRLSAHGALQHPWVQSLTNSEELTTRRIRLQEDDTSVDLLVCCLQSDTMEDVEKAVRLMHRIGSKRTIQLKLLDDNDEAENNDNNSNNDVVEDGQQEIEIQNLDNYVHLRHSGELWSPKTKSVVQRLPSDVNAYVNMLAICENARKLFVTKDQSGLVSLRNFTQGEIAAEIRGRVFLHDEFEVDDSDDPRVFVYDGISDYLDEEAEQITVCVDTRPFNDDSGALRRSCKPNCTLTHVIMDGEFALVVVSNTEIPTNTELTVSPDALWDSRNNPLKCAIHGEEFDKCPDTGNEDQLVERLEIGGDEAEGGVQKKIEKEVQEAEGQNDGEKMEVDEVQAGQSNTVREVIVDEHGEKWVIIGDVEDFSEYFMPLPTTSQNSSTTSESGI